MNRIRVISFVLAILAAFLVIYAGRSCAQNIIETNKKNAAANAPAPSINNYNYDTTDDLTDYQETSEASDSIPVEYVTNLFGEVIGTLPVETEPDSSLNDPDNTPQTTSEIIKSILGTDPPADDSSDITVPAETEADDEPALSQQPTKNSNGHFILSEETQAATQSPTEAFSAPSEIILHIGG